jgi:2-hydroxychromene-2-carboxylate isomerase
MNELQELGFFSTPVTVINDQVVVGFDKTKLVDLLGED